MVCCKRSYIFLGTLTYFSPFGTSVIKHIHFDHNCIYLGVILPRYLTDSDRPNFQKYFFRKTIQL